MRLTLVQSGGIYLVLAALENFGRRSEIITAVCTRALWNLVADDTQAQFQKEDVVPAALASMHNHQASPAVQAACCGLVRNLCVNPVNAATVANRGGIGSLVRALVRHRGHVEVQVQATRALATLSAYRE